MSPKTLLWTVGPRSFKRCSVMAVSPLFLSQSPRFRVLGTGGGDS